MNALALFWFCSVLHRGVSFHYQSVIRLSQRKTLSFHMYMCSNPSQNDHSPSQLVMRTILITKQLDLTAYKRLVQEQLSAEDPSMIPIRWYISKFTGQHAVVEATCLSVKMSDDKAQIQR
jgi:hypothetical protein